MARAVRETAEEAAAEAVVEAIQIGMFIEEQVDLLMITEDLASDLIDRETQVTTAEAFSEVSI